MSLKFMEEPNAKRAVIQLAVLIVLTAASLAITW
jgi:hypothetical protein